MSHDNSWHYTPENPSRPAPRRLSYHKTLTLPAPQVAPDRVLTLADGIYEQTGVPVPRIGIRDTGGPDAWALPGGGITVTPDLLYLLNDHQLQGVLAHEIAHEHLGHPDNTSYLDLILGTLRGWEYDADLQAHQWGFGGQLRDALVVLSPFSGSGASNTHPPIWDRINKLGTYLTLLTERARVYSASALDQEDMA